MTQRLRVVFFGELGSTFSLVHYAVLRRHANVLLWVASRKPAAHAPSTRQPFGSLTELRERLNVRAKLEFDGLRLFGRPLTGMSVKVPIRFTSRGDADLETSLRALRSDLIISAGFGRLIAPTLLQVPRLGAFNCHPSPLPRYAGSNPWFWLLQNGERETAVTIHRMVVEADAGDIVRQQFFPIAPQTNHQQLYNESSLKSAALLKKCLAMWQRGMITESSQDLSQRTFFSAPKDDDRRVDWMRTAEQISDLVRASSPAPGAWAVLNGKRCIIQRVVLVQGSGKAGQVIRYTNDGIVIACGDGALLVHRARVDGRQLYGAQIARALTRF